MDAIRNLLNNLCNFLGCACETFRPSLSIAKISWTCPDGIYKFWLQVKDSLLDRARKAAIHTVSSDVLHRWY